MRQFKVTCSELKEVYIIDENQIRDEALYYYNNSEGDEEIDFSSLQNCIDFVSRVDKVEEIERSYEATWFLDSIYRLHIWKGEFDLDKIDPSSLNGTQIKIILDEKEINQFFKDQYHFVDDESPYFLCGEWDYIEILEMKGSK
jgi:hypothetical protein